jgi:hypothetical protein
LAEAIDSVREQTFDYDKRGRELVGQMCARDIETFGYQFEGAKRCPRKSYV